ADRAIGRRRIEILTRHPIQSWRAVAARRIGLVMESGRPGFVGVGMYVDQNTRWFIPIRCVFGSRSAGHKIKMCRKPRMGRRAWEFLDGHGIRHGHTRTDPAKEI